MYGKWSPLFSNRGANVVTFARASLPRLRQGSGEHRPTILLRARQRNDPHLASARFDQDLRARS